MVRKLKVYGSLDEALSDIGNFNGYYNELVLKHDSENHFDQDCFEQYNSQLEKDLTKKGVDEETSNVVRIIMSELTSNAYRHGVSNDPKEEIRVMTYLSDYGVLIGTKQNKSFFKNEQIKIFEEGKPVPSTYRVKDRLSSNRGTEFITKYATGLLIIKKEKEIYASKLF